MRGAFITVEGGDGAGKTTQTEFIERWLKKRKMTVVRTREPGGTPLGEKLRELLLHADGRDINISERAELLMFFASRAQHLSEIILPALERGEWVLCERFTDATYAYQGGGRGMSVTEIAALEKLAQGDMQPDLTLLLDVPPKVGRARVTHRMRQQSLLDDRFEKESHEFGDAVQEVYRQRAAKFKRFRVVDADQTIKQVRAKIETELDKFVKSFRGDGDEH